MTTQLHEELAAYCAHFPSGEFSEEEWALLQIHSGAQTAHTNVSRGLRLRMISSRLAANSGSITSSKRSYGAGDRDRTGDIQLGKLTFYH